MDNALQPVIRDGTTTGWMFWCPGCEFFHWYNTDSTKKPCWQFNGNPESPTFTPSLRMYDNDGTTCHLFVTDGQIHFCGDCRHDLSGKIVPLEPMPDVYE